MTQWLRADRTKCTQVIVNEIVQQAASCLAPAVEDDLLCE